MWFEIKQQLYFAMRCCKYRDGPVTVTDISTTETKTTLLLEPSAEKEDHPGNDGDEKSSDDRYNDQASSGKDPLLRPDLSTCHRTGDFNNGDPVMMENPGGVKSCVISVE